MRSIERLVYRVLRKLTPDLLHRWAMESLDLRHKSILEIVDEGWGNRLSSETKKPIDKNGDPLPWFTYSTIEYLNQLNLKDLNVLEWGIGNSTRYFAERCQHIVSIEHNKDWFDLISSQLPSNAISYLKVNEEYASFPQTLNRNFDIIIVDGINRADCLKSAVLLLSDKGMIIFDNSDRDPELCKYLRNQNLLEIDFHGFGPINDFTWTTSLFLARRFEVRPLANQPLIPIGGGY